MVQTFANIPEKIEDTISQILEGEDGVEIAKHVEILHKKYTHRDPNQQQKIVKDMHDVLAYLVLRSSATFAQIIGTLNQIKELSPDWQPQSLLDIGSGPGTAIWASKEIWPSIQTATCVDQEKNFLSISQEIIQKAGIEISMTPVFATVDKYIPNNKKYDLVIISNTLNELSPAQQQATINKAISQCSGILVIIEPGTPAGCNTIQKIGQNIPELMNIFAPYIQNSFVKNKETWIHFSQKFIRTDYLRRARQQMRESELMASDWEEAKFSYIAFSTFEPTLQINSRLIGQPIKAKGYIEIPLLTKDEIKLTKILKRNKDEYKKAKELRWGETI